MRFRTVPDGYMWVVQQRKSLRWINLISYYSYDDAQDHIEFLRERQKFSRANSDSKFGSDKDG